MATSSLVQEPHTVAYLGVHDISPDTTLVSTMLGVKSNPPHNDIKYKSWRLVARALVIELRQCQCGATHKIPGATLMLHYQRGKNFRFETWRGNGSVTIPHNLPRRRQYVHTQSELCEDCFVTVDSTQGQLQFEPEPVVEPTHKEVRKAKALAFLDSL